MGRPRATTSSRPFWAAFAPILLGVAFLWGWGANVIAVIDLVGHPVTLMVLLRVAGVFVIPLGAVLGWM